MKSALISKDRKTEREREREREAREEKIEKNRGNIKKLLKNVAFQLEDSRRVDS